AVERAEAADVASALALVVAEAVDVEDERRRGVGADEDVEFVAGADAGSGAVALDHGGAAAEAAAEAGAFRLRVDARVGELPVGGAFAVVLGLDALAVTLGGADAGDERDRTGGGEGAEELAAVERSHGLVSGCYSFRVHSRTVLSQLPLASRLLLGLKATL